MRIRQSTYDDIPRIMELFAAARGIMRSDGNMEQWSGEYPQESVARADIDLGHSFVVEADDSVTGMPSVVGTFAFIPDIEPTYNKIFEGQWLDADGPYATIHRLASTPDSHGVAYECFRWAYEQCTRNGRSLRIDTHRDNRIMRHVIARFGFRYCGIIYLLDGNPRLAYQIL